MNLVWPWVCVLGLTAILHGCRSGTPEPATVEVSSVGLRLIVTRTATHPFLARYNVRLQVEGKEGCAVSADLFPDTGGHSRRNLYQTAAGMIYVLGQFDARVVDEAACTIRLVEFRFLESGATFLGTFDEDAQHRWTFMPASVRAERPFEKL